MLARLPPGLDLDALALETKAIQRRREVVDGAGLLRIALARGPGGLSLRQTAAWAALRGIAELSNPGVKYRLNQAAGFLAALVARLLAAKAPGAELRWPGHRLRLADGTCVSRPGNTSPQQTPCTRGAVHTWTVASGWTRLKGAGTPRRMTPDAFIAEWQANTRNERASQQSAEKLPAAGGEG